MKIPFTIRERLVWAGPYRIAGMLGASAFAMWAIHRSWDRLEFGFSDAKREPFSGKAKFGNVSV